MTAGQIDSHLGFQDAQKPGTNRVNIGCVFGQTTNWILVNF